MSFESIFINNQQSTNNNKRPKRLKGYLFYLPGLIDGGGF